MSKLKKLDLKNKDLDKPLLKISIVMSILTYLGVKIYDLIVNILDYKGSYTLGYSKPEVTIFVIAISFLLLFFVNKIKDGYTKSIGALVGLMLVMPKDVYDFLTANSPMLREIYFVLMKIVAVLFVVMLVKSYKMMKSQDDPNRQINISVLVVLAIGVYFATEISNELARYIPSLVDGNKVVAYIVEYILFSIAMLITLLVAKKSGYANLKYVKNYEVLILIIDVIVKLIPIITYIIQGQYIFRSLYGWIVVYLVWIGAFLVSEAQMKIKAKN